ncbi:MAG: RHS repeat-associated core domain-containing protein [Flammeovirgaceae bacterium]|nr:MAG: RHS repeat-associated core domain-containing protein [Flammeovirgaceae bacterium]
MYEQRHLYNGKELQDELNIGWLDYNTRHYDASIGRFLSQDIALEHYFNWSPYTYVKNNPLIFIDPSGMFTELFKSNGKKIGEDEKGIDGKVRIVTDKSEIKRIKQNYKNNTPTESSSIKTGYETTKTTLTESLNVLDRTLKKTPKDPEGGFHEESSLVMKNNKVIRGESGDKVQVKNGELIGKASLPKLPEGSTYEDVEAAIHSHATGILIADGVYYPMTATEPSKGMFSDQTAFKFYEKNIIVGRLGRSTVTINTDGSYKTTKTPLGAVFYNNRSIEQLRLTVTAMKRITK